MIDATKISFFSFCSKTGDWRVVPAIKNAQNFASNISSLRMMALKGSQSSAALASGSELLKEGQVHVQKLKGKFCKA